MTTSNRTVALVLVAAAALSLWLPTLAVPVQAAPLIQISELA